MLTLSSQTCSIILQSVFNWKSGFAPRASAAATGKAPDSNHLAGALPTDGVGCTLWVDWEVKTEIPDNSHPGLRVAPDRCVRVSR